jgi:hypothetical protein
MILANTNIEISQEIVAVGNSNANVIVTWANNANILAYGLANGLSVVIDYSGYFQRVAAAVETIAFNTNVLANNSNVVLSHVYNISNTLSEISGNSNMIRANTEILAEAANVLANLGNTIGIMTRNSYDTLYGVTTYQYLIEQGRALDTTDVVDERTQELAKDKINEYKPKLRDLL